MGQPKWIDRFFPGIGVVLRYDRSWLRSDLVAAAALFTLLIPAGMAYASAAGLPPVTGLYATIVPLLAYAVFGPSRLLVIGPDSSLAPMIAAAVLPLALEDQDRAVALAGLLAVLTGLILVAGRALKLGFVTGLLSKPIRSGYLNGIALVVFASQLPKLMGVQGSGASTWENFERAAGALIGGGVNGTALAIGLASLAGIAVPKLLGWKIPGILVAVAGSMIATAALGLASVVPVVGALPQGLPAPALAGLRPADVLALVAPAAGIALITFADTGVLSRTLADRYGYRVDGSQEMGALGMANVSAGLLGGFPISGSTSRTPVSIDAGARTQLAGFVAALLVAGFMLLAPGLMAYLPQSTLAAVVIAAVASLVDIRTLVRLARMSRTETVLLIAAFLGVVFVGVLQGIAIAVGLALLAFVRQAWSPYRTELVKVQDVPGFHDVDRHPEGERIPGLVIARFDAPLFFANSALFSDHIRTLVEEAPPPVRMVIVAAEPITGLDTSATDTLVELDKHLEREGIDLVFAEMKGPIKDRLVRFGVGSRFGPDHFFPTTNNAVKAYRGTVDD
ncbi:SulP family inorganic anion transporter [Arthrobacter mangrovi]|uniref:Transporter n=1 Tax=Arthrobacter mangrovi TaxID=2966350 RepID=A0ABQ5MXX9_9MICC|nr:SulP family inorganic anion transporter [Arthrobacter mangrovi]GLB68829.1 transporter [Arthrobacter mangrovi]